MCNYTIYEQAVILVIAPNPCLFHYFLLQFVIYALFLGTQLGSTIKATCIVTACHSKSHCLDQHEF
jgi:hypothetical protein